MFCFTESSLVSNTLDSTNREISLCAVWTAACTGDGICSEISANFRAAPNQLTSRFKVDELHCQTHSQMELWKQICTVYHMSGPNQAG